MERPKENPPRAKSWEERLGVGETIYEEEHECSALSPSLSQSLSSPPTPLHSRVRSWSLATGQETDVSIYVMGTCFRLHKAPLVSKSGYLRRHLTEHTKLTLPLNIKPDTFTAVAEFCYGAHVVISPFNVAALRTAAELLDMTVGDNLVHTTEAYFRRVVEANSELGLTVFRSCLRLLPEAETAASLVSRCVESLELAGGDQEEVDECIELIVSLPPEEFFIVAEAFHCTLSNHDLLYTIVDLHIKNHGCKINEEQKTEICNLVDCDKLSPEFLIHAVQNPRLPLRFIVRAMLIEQVNTRHAVLTASTTTRGHRARLEGQSTRGFSTLGSILRRDAAAREAAHLKAERDATSARIKSLEKELAEMKKFLQELADNNNKKVVNTGRTMTEIIGCNNKHRCSMESIPEEIAGAGEGRSVMDASRSSSFHYGIRQAEVKRGERGSVSFAGARSGHGKEGSPSSGVGNIQRAKKTSSAVGGKGLISRLKKKLWASKPAAASSP